MAQSSIASTVDKLFFAFVPEEGETSGTYFIDIAQCLSIVNRKSYRQGMNYAVENMSFKYAPLGDPQEEKFMSIVVSKVPTTWCADNATTKAFASWMEQRDSVLKEQPSLKAKWSDFKIFLDADHATAGVGDNLIPLASIVDSCGESNEEFVKGEWDMSQFVTPLPGADQAASGDAHELVFHVVGDHIPAGDFTKSTASVGLIKAYAASRALPLTPDPHTEGQYVTGFYNIQQSEDEKSQDIMANVADRNDNPPYSTSEYPGSDTNAPFAQIVKKLYPSNYGSTTNGSMTVSIDNTGSFLAPFGLIRIDTCALSSALDYIILEMDLVPGKYKGILAEKGV